MNCEKSVISKSLPLNAALEANGYTKLGLSDAPYYWSSTEDNYNELNDTYALGVNFYYGSEFSFFKKDPYSVRAVLTFEN